MKPSRFSIVFLLAVLPVALNCECEEPNTVTQDQATVARYHVGAAQTPPLLDDYGQTSAGEDPARAEIEVDFGLVDVDSQSRRYLFLKNTGNAVLNVVEVAWEGAHEAFAVSCLEQGQFVACDYSGSDFLAIQPVSDLVIEMTYAPSEVGAHGAAFLIQSNASDYPTVRVQLRGEGVTPEIQACISDCEGDQSGPDCQDADEICNDQVEPDDLEVLFGDTVTGESVGRAVVLRNLGSQNLTVSSLQLQGGDLQQFRLQVTGGDLPGVIGPGDEATLVVTYQPRFGGDHTTDLQVVSDDVNEQELVIHLTGRGLAPRVCPDPLTLDFGNVAVGEPETKSFTITNCGLLELRLDGVALNPNSSGDFSLLDPPDLPATLQPEESVEVQVVYDPSGRGSDDGGVDIFSDDPASDPATGLTGTVTLMGNGIVRECEIQPIPFALNFGGVVQNESDTMVLTLSNQGNDSCRFDAVELVENSADDEFSIVSQPDPDTTFEPGDVVMPQIEVQYAPTGLGVDNGRLKITGNDKDGPEIFVDLVGEGVETAECEMTIQPTSVRFGTVKLNNTQSQVITVANVGNAVCHVDAPELYPSTLFPSDFSITRGPTQPFVLARKGQPDDRAEIEITFAPTALDLHKATFWLHTDDDPDFVVGEGFCFIPGFPPVNPEEGDACINVTGMSAESDIEVVPSELDFGVVTVGCNSPEMRVTVYNLGTIALNVTDIYLEDPADMNFEIMAAPGTPYSLAGGDSFDVMLRYHPQDTNPHRTTLYIESDASNVELLAVPLFGRGTNISDQTDVFHQPEEVRSDVLFVVDNSGSMGWAQGELADNFDSFIEWATELDVDYHIGVIATEVNEPETGVGDPEREVYPGVLVQAPGRPKIITNATPDLEAAFADNVRVGTCCSDEQEAGLEAAWIALSPPEIDDPSMNGGFLREDAKLYIICISDEQDQSKGNPDFYVDFFNSIKGFRNPELMKVSAIVGDCPDGCGGDTAACGSRYIEVANRTGGIFESICTSNWAAALQALGIDAFAAIREFPLSRPADPSTITVTVNGDPVGEASTEGGADGWTYYGDTNTIFFGDDVVPGKGDRIEVHYTAACL